MIIHWLHESCVLAGARRECEYDAREERKDTHERRAPSTFSSRDDFAELLAPGLIERLLRRLYEKGRGG